MNHSQETRMFFIHDTARTLFEKHREEARGIVDAIVEALQTAETTFPIEPTAKQQAEDMIMFWEAVATEVRRRVAMYSSMEIRCRLGRPEFVPPTRFVWNPERQSR